MIMVLKLKIIGSTHIYTLERMSYLTEIVFDALMTLVYRYYNAQLLYR